LTTKPSNAVDSHTLAPHYSAFRDDALVTPVTEVAHATRRPITSGRPCRTPSLGPRRTSRHISAPVIVKYATDLELLGLL
jgi:hypothetical protein